VPDDQPIEASHADALIEGDSNGGEESKEQEGHHDRQCGQCRSQLFALEVAQDQSQVLHSIGSWDSWPLSR
jgi:hypothetical protein